MTTTAAQAIGQRLNELRTARGVNQEDLARALDVDKSAVSRMEKGDRAIAAVELPIICEALGVTSDQLLYTSDDSERRAEAILLRADEGSDAAAAVTFAKDLIADVEFIEALFE